MCLTQLSRNWTICILSRRDGQVSKTHNSIFSSQFMWTRWKKRKLFYPFNNKARCVLIILRRHLKAAVVDSIPSMLAVVIISCFLFFTISFVQKKKKKKKNASLLLFRAGNLQNPFFFFFFKYDVSFTTGRLRETKLRVTKSFMLH